MADNYEALIPDDALEYNSAVADANSESIARAALQAAAPHLLEVVNTAEELESLWIGSVVLSDGNAYQRYGINDWYGGNASRENSGISLPATVIHNANPYRNK
jgi:hypothetical protein